MASLCNNTFLLQQDISSTPGAPLARAAHSCDVVGQVLVIFGGWAGKHALSDAYAFHTVKRRWIRLNLCVEETPVAVPGSRKKTTFSLSSLTRNNHASAVYGGELFIHGGHDGSAWLMDMFAVDVSTLNDVFDNYDPNVPVDAQVRYVSCNGKVPSKRACHTLTRVDDRFYSFGGYDGSQCFNDLECFDPITATWTRLSKPNGKKPQPRNAHVMVTDGKLLYMNGGHSGRTHFDDIYTYNIATHTWTRVECSGDVYPLAVRGHSACYLNHEIYVFGGYNGEHVFNTLFVFNPRTCAWRRQSMVSEGAPLSRRQRNSMVQHNDTIYIFGGFNGREWLNDMHMMEYRSECTRSFDPILSALADNISVYLANPKYSDVSISVAGKDIPAHKVILCANSKYFDDILSQEDPPEVIELCGWSLDAVMKMIEFMYSSRIRDFHSHTHFKLCEIMGLADACALENLKNMCQEVLVRKMDIDNVCYMLKYSKLYNAELMRQHCFNFIAEHAADVMRTPAFEELSSVPSLVMELAKLSVKS
ncbi:kelch repeat domain containing protein protein, putative [Babesia ovis]|uniref:Kelch repeat domain containing protein protein, putative n=1 Tax=Babesia ovis TaxID=5869 RepID=A0A9W5TD56_BABOV|nr:kelch repeat domain containing protein protein, putative [Babesia ovis]